MALTRLELGSPTVLDGGRSFGKVGPYQRTDGTAYFSVDPNNEANGPITDLSLSPRDSNGRVSFSADFSILLPTDPERGARRMLLDVLNRGGRTAFRYFNGSDQVAAPHVPIDPGNGFLMERGFAVVWCGWQHDVPDIRGLMKAHVPEALSPEGGPLIGKVAVTFQPVSLIYTQPLSDRAHKPYPAAAVDDLEAELTVRDEEDSPRETVPREAWSFAKIVDGKLTPDPDHIYMKSGFQPGKIYQAVYRTNYAPVVGLGLLGTRDIVSHLRHSLTEDNPCAGNIDYAYAFGASQSGRFLREFLYLGLNEDEEHRTVFDGVIPHIAGGRRGEFNQRYGQPSSMVRHSLGHTFPFSDSLQTDPETGSTDGLLARLEKRGTAPKVFLTNSSSEYWRGDASLVHSDVGGTKDIDPSDNVRIYLMAGTQHSRGALPLTDSNPLDGIRGQHCFNTVDYGPLMRSMLVNLDSWVSSGAEPPPSCHPRLDHGDLVDPRSLEPLFRSIPETGFPGRLPPLYRMDFGDEAKSGTASKLPPRLGKAYPFLTPAVDADGNEVSGIRLPDISVPLAAYTGWNLRHPEIGAPDQILRLMGSTLVFPATQGDREASNDPRPSIQERYDSLESYLALVEAEARKLVEGRFLLEEDVEPIIELAARRYRLFAGLTAARLAT